MTARVRSKGSSTGDRYSRTNVRAPERVGYMNSKLPLIAESSMSLSTRIEGELISNMVANSNVLVGGIYLSTIAMSTEPGGTAGSEERGSQLRSAW